MPEFDGLTHYMKAAARRLYDAEELSQPPTSRMSEAGATDRHLRGAMYLAGYAVECILKAYIITHEPPAQSLAQVLVSRQRRGLDTPNLLGARGHNLELLLGLTDLEAALDAHSSYRKDWGVCLKWKTAWRYDPSIPRAKDAREFVQAARALFEWVSGRL